MIFDAKPSYDPRNKQFPAVTKETSRKLQTRFWECPIWLNQEGSYGCSAFATLHNIAAVDFDTYPNLLAYAHLFTERDALVIYNEAQKVDQWAGEEPIIKGTSVVACMKVARKIKLIGSFAHVFGLQQLKQTLSNVGPVAITMPWRYKMTQPDASGLIKVGGPIVGWHSMLVRGMRMENKRFALRQNAGKDYGDEGDVWITFAGMAILLREGGTLCLARMK